MRRSGRYASCVTYTSGSVKDNPFKLKEIQLVKALKANSDKDMSRLHQTVRAGLLPNPSKGASHDESERNFSLIAFDIASGKENGAPRAAKVIGCLLKEIRVDYAVIGAVALAANTSSGRSTGDIDFLLYSKDRRKVVKALESKNIQFEDTDPSQLEIPPSEFNRFGVDFIFAAESDPWESAIELANRKQVFGTPLQVVAPEMQLRLLLDDARTLQNECDAKMLVDSGAVDMKKFMLFMECAGELEVFERAIKLQSASRYSMRWSEFQKKRARGKTGDRVWRKYKGTITPE